MRCHPARPGLRRDRQISCGGGHGQPLPEQHAQPRRASTDESGSEEDLRQLPHRPARPGHRPRRPCDLSRAVRIHQPPPGRCRPHRQQDRGPATLGLGLPDKEGRIWDVSLIRVTGHVDGVRPARIAPTWPWRAARAIGWGITTDPAAWTGPAPAELSQLDVPLLRGGKCAPGGIGAGELCAGVPPTGGGVCDGDSGSGLLQRHGDDWYLLGEASRTIADFCGSAAIYTDLSSYWWWIKQQIRQLLPGAPSATTHTALATPVG